MPGTTPRGIQPKDGYAIVSPSDAATDFASLAATIEDLRDAPLRNEPAIRVAVLDLTRPLGQGYVESEAAVLGRCVLPLVAAWDGQVIAPALAAGLWCDIRVMTPAVTFHAEGLHAPTVERLVEVVAPGRDPERSAGDIQSLGIALASAQPCDAAAMLDAGLVTHIAQDGLALLAAAALARTIASRGPFATQLAKEAIWRGLRLPFEHALRFETDLTLLLQTTNDRAEGVRAFTEKRPPEFKGA